VCVNGHFLNPGDLLCGLCGGDARGSEAGTPGDTTEEPQAPQEIEQVTVIQGWEVVSRLAGGGTTECFRVAGREGATGILTLYPPGPLADPAVDAAVDALAPAVATKVLARGEYEGRRFEVVEAADGRTFADAAISAGDSEGFRRVVRALGAGLHALSRAGLRHRDLRPNAIVPGPEDAWTICRFGFARLTSHDLDTASPHELSRYSAPELLVGAVSPASDWWSLGVILLEKLTQGACFEGVSDQAFLMDVVANGAHIPAALGEEARLLLRGLLARDRNVRWQWEDVEAWSMGEPRAAPDEGKPADDAEAGSIALGGRTFRVPSKYALAAGRGEHWAEARDQLLRGVITT